MKTRKKQPGWNNARGFRGEEFTTGAPPSSPLQRARSGTPGWLRRRMRARRTSDPLIPALRKPSRVYRARLHGAPGPPQLPDVWGDTLPTRPSGVQRLIR